ncbi:MAG: orotidine-5'-phosphate decarboxylase [Phycisphaerae bacterium]
MPQHIADKLADAIAQTGSPVCVGIDPRYDRFPAELTTSNPTPTQTLEAFRTFCFTVVDQVAGLVPAIKPQSAYFEVLGPAGVELYFETISRAHEKGLLVIGDVKRNDIGSTAEAYAAAHLSGPDKPDFITINGYLGEDGIAPFVDIARAEGKGVFVLVRTSNPSAKSVQDFCDDSGKPLYKHVAEMVGRVGSDCLSDSGYSCVGAVVGATWPEEAAELRRLMPEQLFLVPGYGAQGATAKDCAAGYKEDGSGALVNASRSVIYAHANKDYAFTAWPDAIHEAARLFAQEIASAVMP